MGDDPSRFLLALDELGSGVELQVVADPVEESLVGAEQFDVRPLAALVPITEVDPSIVLVLVVDLAFLRDDEVWVGVDDVVGYSSDRLEEAAPGVDRPGGAPLFL